MKTDKSTFMLLIALLFAILQRPSIAQTGLPMVVNSLADDEDAHPWDDPDTEEDESRDGVCKDYQGRCTLRAAIEESNLMEYPVDLSFIVSGTVNLIDDIYPYSHSKLTANLPIEITGNGSFILTDYTRLLGFTFNNMLTGVRIEGRQNHIGDWGDENRNTFIKCYVGLQVDGDTNWIQNNRFGVDASNSLQGNYYAILSNGKFNVIGGDRKYGESNVICGSTETGIYLADGNRCFIEGNYVGTTPGGDKGYGNSIGILVSAVDSTSMGLTDFDFANIVSGNETAGILVSGVPGESNSKNLYIAANIIGLDSSRTVAIPNGQGIMLTNGVRNGSIKDNVIAGNNQSAILLVGPDQETTISDISITGNKIGVNDKGNRFPNGLDGIGISGFVEHVQIGSNSTSRGDEPNQIIGNQGYGILLLGDTGNDPSAITFRKNIIYQNEAANIFVSPFANNGIQPPYGLTYSNNTIAGISDEPNALIDIYKADINEFSPSAYVWIGSTTAGENGVFSYELFDPSIEAVSLTATTSDGSTSDFAYLELISGVEEDQDNNNLSLRQNYPNPYAQSTIISFSIPKEEHVSLEVFDQFGDEIAFLVNETKHAGNYDVTFNGSELHDGIYTYRLVAGSLVLTRKMTLIH